MRVSWDSGFRQYEIFGDLPEWQRILAYSGNPNTVTKAQTVVDCLTYWPRHFHHAIPGMPGEFRVRLSLDHWHDLIPAAVQAGVIGRAVTPDTADDAGPWHTAECCGRSMGARGGVKARTCEWRRNGRTQRWKRDAGRFRIPVKFGLRSYDAITEITGISVHSAADCPYGI